MQGTYINRRVSSLPINAERLPIQQNDQARPASRTEQVCHSLRPVFIAGQIFGSTLDPLDIFVRIVRIDVVVPILGADRAVARPELLHVV